MCRKDSTSAPTNKNRETKGVRNFGQGKIKTQINKNLTFFDHSIKLSNMGQSMSILLSRSLMT